MSGELVSTTRSRSLLPALGGVTVVLYICYAAPVSVLLPVQVEALDPVAKVGNLAIVTSVSAAVTVLAQPILGALSDRTQSRLGRRAPWMIGGALVGAGALVGLSGAQSVLALAVLWSVAQFALNGVDIASSSFLVDRIPRERRGVGAAVFAGSAISGGAVGSLIAAPFVHRLGIGYALLGGAIVVAVAIFVLLVRSPTGEGLDTARFSVWKFVRELWVDPRRFPDFAWVVASRFAFTLGFGAVYGYLLYFAMDDLGLPTAEASRLVGLVTLIGGAAMLVSITLGGWISDRVGRRPPFVVGAGLALAAALVIPLVWPVAPGLLLFAVLQGVGSGLAVGCGTALASEVLPDERRAGRGLGLYNVAATLPQVFAPPLAAAVIPVAGYTGLFAVGIVSALAAAFSASRVRAAR